MKPQRLRFGTAGIRGPVREGVDAMNVDTVARVTAALAHWLVDHGHTGASVVVGRDARHGSAQFFDTTVAVLQRRGFDVIALPGVVPTPVLAFTTRALSAAAGVMITASHNPPADNGYKVYLGGGVIDAGAQIVPPVDAEIEAWIDRIDSLPTDLTRATTTDERADTAVDAYLARLSARFGHRPSQLRIALTPMHGVGGEVAVRALRAAGFTDIHTVTEQFDPDPDFPTVSFPNPEEPGAADLLLALADRVDADLAIALDPDADRCAIGTRIDGAWRMLTGDETGALLGAAALAGGNRSENHSAATPLVATTIVSGSILGAIATAAGAQYRRTLTGFKWLVRAGDDLVYAYEEAIGHCVDPTAVRDKDGISAAVACARIADDRSRVGEQLCDALDALFVAHGVHRTAQLSVRTHDVGEVTGLMSRLREAPPASLAGFEATLTDHARRDDELATDAVEFTGSNEHMAVRIIVRPSGTEPKVKFYLEVACHPSADLATATATADAAMTELRSAAAALTQP
ncbi:phospho-sugar mutase [Williamsia sp. CHRR-6]|uniref:phospho-sugar mutase n=1 Tax=Williamsia sp. CHRR-6 TaxID=2835871 RepID=UPI0027DDFF50|nr:phospho-sugar mutase [Williamsia sp. CHRR-6]